MIYKVAVRMKNGSKSLGQVDDASSWMEARETAMNFPDIATALVLVQTPKEQNED